MIDGPRRIARNVMRSSIPEKKWIRNQDFVEGLISKIKCHRVCTHPAIAALKGSVFDLKELQAIHLEYRYAIVQIFTDALLMAQFQCRQLEPRLNSGQKMFPRFLLTLNVLDEFGFYADHRSRRESRYSGNPFNAHYPLFESVLDELNVTAEERENYVPSLAAQQLKDYLEDSYGALSTVVTLLGVAEEIVILFSAPLRENSRNVGVKVDRGYYFCHGSSDDSSIQAVDDTHASDLWQVLIQCLEIEEYEHIEKICSDYCSLWSVFWDFQCQGALMPNGFAAKTN